LRHNHLPIEHIPKEIKDKHTPPVGRSAVRGKDETNVVKSEKQEKLEKLEKLEKQEKNNKSVPQYLSETAEYFLLKTGRDKLTDSEIEALIAISEIHALPRINREISVAVERFKTQGKSLKLLKMNYIQEALKYQKSTKKKTESTPEKTEVEGFGFTLQDVIRTYQMGGEDPEDLPILCDMYQISDDDTKKVFAKCGVKYQNEEAELIVSV